MWIRIYLKSWIRIRIAMMRIRRNKSNFTTHLEALQIKIHKDPSRSLLAGSGSHFMLMDPDPNLDST
jgi:hypothetical protein